ncbi:MAG: hydroxymethylbilane synthase [Gemmatimonadales bacterium]
MLRIGTRGSALALWQANHVGSLLSERGVAAEIITIRTSGDEGGIRHSGIAVKGTFTKEIETALVERRVDIAVHSLKDLMIDLPPGLVVAAYPERADRRDALVTRERVGLADLPRGARVGTASLRRRAAVLRARPDLHMIPLRGNVPTRLRRVDDGTVDAAVLAMAGLERLGLGDRGVPLDPEVVVPAPGQGALAIEARELDTATLEIIAALDDEDVRMSVEAERAALARLETGCNVPIGATCLPHAGRWNLRVTVYAVDGTESMTSVVPVDADRPRAAGTRAAEELLGRGARRLIDGAMEAATGGEVP